MLQTSGLLATVLLIHVWDSSVHIWNSHTWNMKL